jgi:hypothetical protein
MTGYRSTPLFGGALVCDLPDRFADVRFVCMQPNWALN